MAAFPRLPNAGLVPETRREVAIAAVLLAFAQECAPAQDACGRPLGCVIDAGPFNGAGLGAEAGEGSDVEPRMAKALAASNFARGTAPPLRVYRVP